jgi:hypothetical protein
LKTTTSDFYFFLNSIISYWTHIITFFFRNEKEGAHKMSHSIDQKKSTSLVVCKHFNSLSSIYWFYNLSFHFLFFNTRKRNDKNKNDENIMSRRVYIPFILDLTIYMCVRATMLSQESLWIVDNIFLYSSLTGYYTTGEHLF